MVLGRPLSTGNTLNDSGNLATASFVVPVFPVLVLRTCLVQAAHLNTLWSASLAAQGDSTLLTRSFPAFLKDRADAAPHHPCFTSRSQKGIVG